MEEIKETITVSIMGDICPDWGFPDSFALGNPEKVFGDVLPLIREADYAIANLECPASNVGVPIKKTGPNLRCRKSDIAVLKKAGLDAVSLANNHIYDYGETALLKSNGMNFVSRKKHSIFQCCLCVAACSTSLIA